MWDTLTGIAWPLLSWQSSYWALSKILLNIQHLPWLIIKDMEKSQPALIVLFEYNRLHRHLASLSVF